MIYLAILLHILGDYAPRWILKEKYTALRDSFSWKYSITMLSGILVSFLAAFLLIAGVTFSTKDRYVANSDAIYGLEFSPMMKGMGFQDGDRIISINGQEVDRTDKIVIMILMAPSDAVVEISGDEGTRRLIITEADKQAIIKSCDIEDIKARMKPDSISGNALRKVKITEVNRGLADVFNAFHDIWKQYSLMFSPAASEYSNLRGFIVISKVTNVRGYLFVLALCSLFVGMLNFLPLPGFDFGNLLVSIVEKHRRKHFNKRIINTLKIAFISLVILFTLIGIYMFK
jgi:membrane-associated protease RseP (regulator of RpoE activity)